MEEAGEGIARGIGKFVAGPGRCLVFAGKGHNAGDAFVAARFLAEAGWAIETRLVFPEKELSELTARKLAELRATLEGRPPCRPRQVGVLHGRGHEDGTAPVPPNDGLTIVLDGLLGLGAKLPLRDPIRSGCREINAWRERGATIVAIDLPTGLEGDTGAADKNVILADVTMTIGFAKKGLVADDAIDYVGRLEVVPLADLRVKKADDAAVVATPETLQGLLPRRRYSAYKNQFGRVGIVAGSRGLTGAAVLCSLGALRAGAGLVELFVPEAIYEIVAAAAAPEVMVKPVSSYEELLDAPVDVWAIGPGLGKEHAEAILALIREAKQPMVIDADALNILAGKMKTLSEARGPRLLTPHPGEMKRIFPVQKKSRADWTKKFCRKYDATLLLKGSRTVIAERGRPLSYNTTGTPGMATGGMGDVLTGVCGALLGAGLVPNDAARLGAWVCGRAAELAIRDGGASEESLLPSDLLAHLGATFRELSL